MAKPTAKATLQLHINRVRNFLNFTRAFLKKNNPIKIFIASTLAYIKEIATVKQKLKKIEYRINYEKYKLKKTELILAQNSEHVFLKGRSLNQTR
ncbi:TPA: hypothetical protein IAA87_05635 [Candidatus Avigastranaerophilus faecigallinarum]|nr:hypothetical protein [Candidatus Avigastranaerophilus faecigallinarum]